MSTGAPWAARHCWQWCCSRHVLAGEEEVVRRLPSDLDGTARAPVGAPPGPALGVGAAGGVAAADGSLAAVDAWEWRDGKCGMDWETINLKH